MNNFQRLPLLNTPDAEEIIRKDIAKCSYNSISDQLEETTEAIAKLSKRPIWARLFRNTTSAGIKLALSIPLILDKIFKNLNYSDRKSFRAVNKDIYKYFVEKWKDENWLRINNDRKYLNLYRGFKRIDKEGKIDLLENLRDHVFSHVIFSESVFIQILNRDSELHEIFFWRCYAPHITHLNLEYCVFEKGKEVDTIRWILSKCPNLVELRINGYFSVKAMYNRKRMDDDPFQGCLNAEEGTVKLERLHLDQVDFLDVHLPLICKLASNLQALTGNSITIWNMMGKRLRVGAFSNLRKLDITLLKAVDFLCFTNYVTKYGANLQELFVKSNQEGLNEIVLYDSLGLCTHLEKLKLHFEISKRYNYNPAGYSKLSSVNFSNLKRFHLKISTERDMFLINLQNFDLNILKGMPALEELYLSLRENNKCCRGQPGIANWVDPETNLLSEPVCKNLKKFTLDGFWPLEQEDVFLFKDWFPSLQYLHSPFNLDSFSLSFELWESTLQVIVAGHRSEFIENKEMKRIQAYYKNVHVFKEIVSRAPNIWDSSEEIEVITVKNIQTLFVPTWDMDLRNF